MSALNGSQTTLLIHVEFQNQVDQDLVERLYNYNIGVYLLLQEKVMSVAVPGDDDPRWRPAEFRYAIGDFETRMRFPVAKLLDYEAQWQMLEQSDNPFAVFVMAHLRALSTMGQPDTRLEWKIRLATALYARGYSAEQIQQLVDFIDWLMVLDDKREERFDEMMRKYEVEHTMETLSPYQKRFIAKGKQEGRQEGRQEGLQMGRCEDLLEVLRARFEVVPLETIEAVRTIASPERLAELFRAALHALTLRRVPEAPCGRDVPLKYTTRKSA